MTVYCTRPSNPQSSAKEAWQDVLPWHTLLFYKHLQVHSKLIGHLSSSQDLGKSPELQQRQLHGSTSIINGVMGAVLNLPLQKFLCEPAQRRSVWRALHGMSVRV